MINKDVFAGSKQFGFIWWFGVIEDRDDPLKMGRCRVRIVGWDSESLATSPLESLRWAIVSLPVNNANVYSPKEGDKVIGFFLDGESAQQPVILGVIPHIPLEPSKKQSGFNDTRNQSEINQAPSKPGEQRTNYPRMLDEPTVSRLSRNQKDYPHPLLETKKKQKSSSFEQDTAYNAKYPYNNAIESESGHAIEIDDTPGHERLHFYHRTGSYNEYRPDGSVQHKTVKNRYEAIDGDSNLYVKGNKTIKIDGNLTFDVKKNIIFKAGGSINGSAGASIGLSAKTTFSASAFGIASLTGQAKTSVGGMISLTDVSGSLVNVKGKAKAELSAPLTNMGGSGITTLTGSMIKIGKTGSGVDSADDAKEAVGEAAAETDPSAATEAAAASAADTVVSEVQVGEIGVLNQGADAVGSLTEVAGETETALQALAEDATGGDTILGITVEVDSTTGTVSYFDIDGNSIIDSNAPIDVQYFDDGSSILTYPDGRLEAIELTREQIIESQQGMIPSIRDGIAPGTIIYGDDGSYVRYLSDGSKYVQDADGLITIETATGQIREATTFDLVTTSADSYFKAAVDAASKVDVGNAITKSATDLAKQITEPFVTQVDIIKDNWNILSSDTAKLSEKYIAAKQIISSGLAFYGTAVAVTSVDPRVYLTQFAAGTVTGITDQYENNINNSTVIKNAKSDMSAALLSYSNDVKTAFTGASSNTVSFVTKALDDMSINTNSAARDILRAATELRENGAKFDEINNALIEDMRLKTRESISTFSGAPSSAINMQKEINQSTQTA